MIVSEFNRLDGDRYFDVESSTSFEFDHITQVYCLTIEKWICVAHVKLDRPLQLRNHIPSTRKTQTLCMLHLNSWALRRADGE